MYMRVVNRAVDIIKNFDEVEKIIFFGSAYRGNKNPSDIDLYIVVDPLVCMNPDLNGIPQGLRKDLSSKLSDLEVELGVLFDLNLCSSNEYFNGITFPIDKNRKRSGDTLNNVGEIVFDAYL